MSRGRPANELVGFAEVRWRRMPRGNYRWFGFPKRWAALNQNSSLCRCLPFRDSQQLARLKPTHPTVAPLPVNWLTSEAAVLSRNLFRAGKSAPAFRPE